LTSFAEGLGLEGSVGRDVLAFFAHGSLAGKVGGSVRAKGDSLVIGSTAVIDDRSASRAQATGGVFVSKNWLPPSSSNILKRNRSNRESDYYIWRVIWTAAFVLFGNGPVPADPEICRRNYQCRGKYGAPIGLVSRTLP